MQHKYQKKDIESGWNTPICHMRLLNSNWIVNTVFTLQEKLLSQPDCAFLSDNSQLFLGSKFQIKMYCLIHKVFFCLDDMK